MRACVCMCVCAPHPAFWVCAGLCACWSGGLTWGSSGGLPVPESVRLRTGNPGSLTAAERYVTGPSNIDKGISQPSMLFPCCPRGQPEVHGAQPQGPRVADGGGGRGVGHLRRHGGGPGLRTGESPALPCLYLFSPFSIPTLLFFSSSSLRPSSVSGPSSLQTRACNFNRWHAHRIQREGSGLHRIVGQVSQHVARLPGPTCGTAPQPLSLPRP